MEVSIQLIAPASGAWSGEYYQTDNPIIHEPAINGREYLTAYLTKEETIVGEIYFVREFPRGNFYSFRDLKNVEIGRATGFPFN